KDDADRIRMIGAVAALAHPHAFGIHQRMAFRLFENLLRWGRSAAAQQRLVRSMTIVAESHLRLLTRDENRARQTASGQVRPPALAAPTRRHRRLPKATPAARAHGHRAWIR